MKKRIIKIGGIGMALTMPIAIMSIPAVNSIKNSDSQNSLSVQHNEKALANNFIAKYKVIKYPNVNHLYSLQIGDNGLVDLIAKKNHKKYTVKISPNTNLGEGSKVNFIITAKKGYIWKNGQKIATITKVLHNLPHIVKKDNFEYKIIGIDNFGVLKYKKDYPEFTVKASKDEHLSNGDIVTFTLKAKKHLVFRNGKTKKLLKVKIIKRRIVGLVVLIDDPDFSYEVEDNGELTYNKNKVGFTIQADKEKNLKNGDTVTFTLKAKYGFVFTHNRNQIKIKKKVHVSNESLIKNKEFHWKIMGFDGKGEIAFEHEKDKFTVSTNKTTNLSNGDKIPFTLKAKKGYIFPDNKKEIIVIKKIYGLTVINIINSGEILKKINIQIKGINGKGELTFNAETTEFFVSINKTSNLSNEDVVTLSLKAKNGFIFHNKTKEMTLYKPIGGLLKIIKNTNFNWWVKGFNNEGQLTYESEKDEFTISANKTTNLSNGDEVPFILKAKNGYVFENEEKIMVDSRYVNNLKYAPKTISTTDLELSYKLPIWGDGKAHSNNEVTFETVDTMDDSWKNVGYNAAGDEIIDVDEGTFTSDVHLHDISISNIKIATKKIHLNYKEMNKFNTINIWGEDYNIENLAYYPITRHLGSKNCKIEIKWTKSNSDKTTINLNVDFYATISLDQNEINIKYYYDSEMSAYGITSATGMANNRPTMKFGDDAIFNEASKYFYVELYHGLNKVILKDK